MGTFFIGWLILSAIVTIGFGCTARFGATGVR